MAGGKSEAREREVGQQQQEECARRASAMAERKEANKDKAAATPAHRARQDQAARRHMILCHTPKPTFSKSSVEEREARPRGG